MPATNSAIASQALTTSSSRFLASFVIDDLPRGLDFALEVWIANATLGQQVNFATEQPLDCVSEIEVAVGIGTGRLVGKTDDEIEIALRGIEIRGADGS